MKSEWARTSLSRSVIRSAPRCSGPTIPTRALDGRQGMPRAPGGLGGPIRLQARERGGAAGPRRLAHGRSAAAGWHTARLPRGRLGLLPVLETAETSVLALRYDWRGETVLIVHNRAPRRRSAGAARGGSIACGPYSPTETVARCRTRPRRHRSAPSGSAGSGRTASGAEVVRHRPARGMREARARRRSRGTARLRPPSCRAGIDPWSSPFRPDAAAL